MLSPFLRPYDFLIFIDILILIGLLAFKFVKIEVKDMKRRKVATIFLLGIVISSANLIMAEMDRPQLLTRAFDRNYIVKYLGMYNFTIYDAVQSANASTQRALADGDDMTEVRNFPSSTYATKS